MARVIKTPIDPVKEATKHVKITSKILVAMDNLKLTDEIYEQSIKNALENAISFLSITINKQDVEIELADTVLSITGPIAADNIHEFIPKIYAFRDKHITGRTR